MTTRSDLLSQSISEAFGGDASQFNVITDFKNWFGNRESLGYLDSSGQFHWLIDNDSTFLFGQNSEPYFSALVESNVLYSGSSSTNNIIQSVQDKFNVLGLSAHWEARWGLDSEMVAATPWVSSLDRISYTIDKFLSGTVNNNWNSTDKNSLTVSEEEIIGKYSKNSGEAFPKKKLLFSSQVPYRSHPVASGQRAIRFITFDSSNNKVYGTGDTNEQFKEWVKDGAIASDEPDGPGLHEIDPSTGVSTFLGTYNGSFFDSSSIKQIHLLAYDQSNSELIGLMPRHSHAEYEKIENHAGTLVTINVSTQEVEFKSIVLSDGGLNLKVNNFFYDQNLNNFMVLARVSEDIVEENGELKGFEESYDIIGRLDFESSVLANITRIYKFSGAIGDNRNTDFTKIHARSASSGPEAHKFFVVASKPVISTRSSSRWLYVVDVLNGDEAEEELAYLGDDPVDGIVYNSGTDEIYGVETGGYTFFVSDVSGVDFSSPEEFSDDNLEEEEQGVMKITSLGPGSSRDSVYTRLNVDNSRAFSFYDVIAITAESNVSGEILEFEYGDLNRSDLPKYGRMPRHQSIKMNFEEANKVKDFYFLINRNIFNNEDYFNIRHMAFNVIDANVPFEVRISRIQLLKTNDDVLNFAPTADFFSEHSLEARFASDDVRRLSKFVQYRVLLTTIAPPITPKVRGEMDQSIDSATIINHPSGRLRGGRRRTPNTIDNSLNLGNELYTQTPLKLPTTEIQDALGIQIN